MQYNTKSSNTIGNKLFLNKLTVFVITVDSIQLNYALQGLKEQNCEFKIDIIKNISPMSEAFNQMIERCNTEYFIQVDEDMILYPDTIEYMVDSMEESLHENQKVAIQSFRLLDKELGSILGVKIYNYSIMKHYRWKNAPVLDRLLNEQLKDDGYKILSSSNKDHNVGTHALHRSNFELFLKSVVIGSRVEKSATTKSGDLNHFFSLYENALTDRDKDKTFLRLAGLFYGLYNEFQPDFTKYPDKQFKNLEFLLDFLHEKELNKKIEFANKKLTGLFHGSQKNIFNLSDRIYEVWKNKEKFYSHFDKKVLRYLFSDQSKEIYILNDLGSKMTFILQLLNKNVSISILDVKDIIKYKNMCKYIIGSENKVSLMNKIAKIENVQILVVNKHSVKVLKQNIETIEDKFDELLIEIDDENFDLLNFKYDSLSTDLSFGRWIKC